MERRRNDNVRFSVLVAVLVVVVGGSAAAHDWWTSRGVPTAVTQNRAAAQIKPAYRSTGLPTWRGGEQQSEPVPPAETREVIKCVVNGRVTYTAQDDCQSGSRVAVRITGGLSPDELRDAQSRAEELAEQAAEIDRQAEWRAWHREQQLANGAPPGNLTKTSECANLEQAISAYDAQARQPQPAAMQDWIKDRRAEARSRQFALRC
jgi:hypothetical protein